MYRLEMVSSLSKVMLSNPFEGVIPVAGWIVVEHKGIAVGKSNNVGTESRVGGVDTNVDTQIARWACEIDVLPGQRFAVAWVLFICLGDLVQFGCAMLCDSVDL